MSAYILAHDLGTSGNKASLFSEEGKLIASVTESYPTYYGGSGFAEQDPDEWWRAVCTATRKVTEFVDKKDIAVVSVTGQMMGTVCLDKEGQLLGNSIIWSDTRAVKECETLSEELGGKAAYYRITGQPPSASYTFPKLMWLKEHRRDFYDRIGTVIQSKDYITYRLTGVAGTDPTDAAYTTAYDIEKDRWSEEIIRAGGIRSDIFPEVRESASILGRVTEQAAEECGLLEGTPVAVGAGDGSAAHPGAGCVEDGDAYICLGSSTWIVAQTDRLIFDDLGRMQSEPHVIKDKYCFLGTMQTGGLAYDWARKNLSDGALPYDRLDSLISGSAPGAGGTVFLPYLMGERSPWYDLGAKGAFLGLTMQTEYGDIYRSVMEGVAMNLNIMLKVIREHLDVKKIVLIGGGGKSRIWQQILADVLDAEMLIPENIDSGTSIGGAIVAGIACGIWPDFNVSKKFLSIGSTVHPDRETGEIYKKLQSAFESGYYALREWNKLI